MKSVTNSIENKKSCYGNLFPDFLKMELNRTNRGHVFSLRVESCGIGIQSREMAFDEEVWEECLQCPRFEGCYKSSMAGLAMQSAVRLHF